MFRLRLSKPVVCWCSEKKKNHSLLEVWRVWNQRGQCSQDTYIWSWSARSGLLASGLAASEFHDEEQSNQQQTSPHFSIHRLCESNYNDPEREVSLEANRWTSLCDRQTNCCAKARCNWCPNARQPRYNSQDLMLRHMHSVINYSDSLF